MCLCGHACIPVIGRGLRSACHLLVLNALNSSFVADAIKLEEAAAEKRYFDGLIHDGIRCITLSQSVYCNALCFAVDSFAVEISFFSAVSIFANSEIRLHYSDSNNE